MPDHQPMPVVGYKPQSENAVAQVNENKVLEEDVLQRLDELEGMDATDKRWLSIGRTHIEQAFMAINRSIFKPGRAMIRMPSDQGD